MRRIRGILAAGMFAGASWFARAGNGGVSSAGENAVTLESGLTTERPGKSHLALALKFSVDDPAAHGGMLIRIGRDAQSIGEPCLQFFIPVSGALLALSGSGALPLSSLAGMSAPHPGGRDVDIRIFPGATGTRMTYGKEDVLLPGVIFKPGDLGPETALEVSSFGSGLTFESAKLGWKNSGTMVIFR